MSEFVRISILLLAICVSLYCWNCPLDVRPIAVGETLRRLASKCICAIVKNKASEFFSPFQLGVACYEN